MISPLNIVFCIDKGGLPGLGATLASLFLHCSDRSQLVIYLFNSNLDIRDKNEISKLCSRYDYSIPIRYIPISVEASFTNLSSFHGSLMNYARLLIADTLDLDRVLYIDADLIIKCDVHVFRTMDLGDNVIAAAKGSSLKHRIDCEVLTRNGCSEDMPYFNAGVLLIDLDKWRTRGLRFVLESFIRQNSDLPSHDQTVLNYLFQGAFYDFSDKYNSPWMPKNKLSHTDDQILHFIGSPKPWDFLGKQIHLGYTEWFKYSDALWREQYLCRYFTLNFYKRIWRIRRSIIRNLIS